MRLSISFVAVKKITPTVLPSSFSDEELNQAAELILKAEGMINPLVLRRSSLESYQVVSGDLEYYAAARAREINPLKGEMVEAYIITPENEDAINKQIALLRREALGSRSKTAQAQSPANFESQGQVEKPVPDKAKQLEVLFQAMELSFQEKVEALTSKVDQVNESVRRLEDVVSQRLAQQPEATHEEISITESQPANYAGMTVPQLKRLAKQRGLTNYSKLKKPQLVAALTRGEG